MIHHKDHTSTLVFPRFDDSSSNKIYYVRYELGPALKWLGIDGFSYNHLRFGPNNIPCFKNDIFLMNEMTKMMEKPNKKKWKQLKAAP